MKLGDPLIIKLLVLEQGGFVVGLQFASWNDVETHQVPSTRATHYHTCFLI